MRFARNLFLSAQPRLGKGSKKFAEADRHLHHRLPTVAGVSAHRVALARKVNVTSVLGTGGCHAFRGKAVAVCTKTHCTWRRGRPRDRVRGRFPPGRDTDRVKMARMKRRTHVLAGEKCVATCVRRDCAMMDRASMIMFGRMPWLCGQICYEFTPFLARSCTLLW